MGRVLVTGAAGFIGSNLAKALETKREDEVVALDSFRWGAYRNLEGFTGEIVAADLLSVNLETLFRHRPLAKVYHIAALTDTTVTDEALMMSHNSEAFRRVLEYARDHGAQVVYASSASVYGNGPVPMREDQPLQPQNIYAFSKMAMERIARVYYENYDVPVVGLRYFNVYGPGETHKGTARSMVLQIMEAMVKGEAPRLFRNGEQKRDFVFIDDVVRATMSAADHPDGGVYNIGSGQATSFNEVVRLINRCLGSAITPEWIENPYAFYQTETLADVSRARALLGYSPQFLPNRGIAEYFSRLNPTPL
jgi:ADP-L-glycero-D-manno-heptose 6-epimerase